MAKVKSKRFEGVYYNELQNGDKSYYIVYRPDPQKSPVWEKIGLHNDGIREAYCDQKRRDRINMIRHGEIPPEVEKKRKKEIITLDSIYDEMMERKEIAHTTKLNYGSMWRVRFKEHIGGEDIRSITPKHIADLKKKWTGAERIKFEAIGLLNRVYKYAAEYHPKLKGIVNPVTEFRTDEKKHTSRAVRSKIMRSRERFLDMDEINRLRRAVKDDFMDALAVELLLSTGARITSALHICKKDVSLSTGVIRIKDMKAGGEEYNGFISEALQPLLEKRLQQIKSEERIMGYGSYTVFQTRFKKILDPLFNVGLDSKDSENRIVIHSLRHTFASHLAINGTPIFTIQKLMNHKDIKMTMRYAKLAPDSGKEAVRKLYGVF
jgi:integrase